MTYFTGFVAAVPTANKDKYTDHVTAVWPLFESYGANRMVETWGVDVPKGKVTDFLGAVQATDGETIVFSWVEWPDRETVERFWNSDEYKAAKKLREGMADHCSRGGITQFDRFGKGRRGRRETPIGQIGVGEQRARISVARAGQYGGFGMAHGFRSVPLGQRLFGMRGRIGMAGGSLARTRRKRSGRQRRGDGELDEPLVPGFRLDAHSSPL